MSNEDIPSSSNSQTSIYHEQQKKLLCGVHALNNLLQTAAFTQKSFDNICEELSPESRYWNPHRNPIGLGNYDINVLMKAMSHFNLEVVWFDKRKPVTSIQPANIFGYLVNIPSPYKLFPFINGKHWVAIRWLNGNGSSTTGAFYNLDSKLPNPVVVANTESELVDHLSKLMQVNQNTELLLVVNNDVAKNQTWQRSS